MSDEREAYGDGSPPERPSPGSFRGWAICRFCGHSGYGVHVSPEPRGSAPYTVCPWCSQPLTATIHAAGRAGQTAVFNVVCDTHGFLKGRVLLAEAARLARCPACEKRMQAEREERERRSRQEQPPQRPRGASESAESGAAPRRGRRQRRQARRGKPSCLWRGHRRCRRAHRGRGGLQKGREGRRPVHRPQEAHRGRPTPATCRAPLGRLSRSWRCWPSSA